MVLDFDLNDPPPGGDRALEGTSSSISPQEMQDGEHVQSQPQAIMDVEAIDDDVVISSPQRFYEARSKSRRSCEVIVVPDEDTGLYKGQSELKIWLPLSCDKRRRSAQNQKDANWELYINLEVSSKTKTKNVLVPSELPPSVPLPEAPTFCCPVCTGQLIKETSTKCGHIFCEKCIKGAIAAQSKCPTCRQKLTVRDIIRVYLPATSQLN